MMLRFLTNNLNRKWINIIITRPSLQHRCINYKTEIVIGGGLEKLQGGLKEEKYFHERNCDLITKMGEQGTELKCEHFVSDCNQFEKVLDASDDLAALRDTCAPNKHKNCLEEAYFLNEQSECCTKLCKQDTLTKEETDFNTVAENMTKNIQ